MDWLERYREGSFRGVPFKTQRHDAEGGRRTVAHQYPDRDIPWSEDLGRQQRRWSIECLVIGKSYMEERDALRDALEAEGPGLLIHPYLGEINATAPRFRYTESSEEGGIARFSIEFEEAGQRAISEAAPDTAEAARSTANLAQSRAASRFGRTFSTDQLPAFAEEGAVVAVRRLATSAEGAAQLLAGKGPLLNAWHVALGAFDDALVLVRSPFTLADATIRLVEGVAALGEAPLARLRALTRMFEGNHVPARVIGNTPVRLAERTNGRALADLVTVATAAAMARTISEVDFGSWQEAVAERSRLTGLLGDASLAAADRGNDAMMDDLDELARAITRDVETRSATLARLTRYQPQRSVPVLALAWTLYGDYLRSAQGLEAEGGDIMARNRLRHPALVPGAVMLDVLSNAGVAGAGVIGRG